MSTPPWRSGKSAFIPVQPRTGLGRSAPAPPAGPPPDRPKTQWPDSLRRFVERSLEEGADVDKPQVQYELREIITKAFETNTAWDVDWDKIVLPIVQRRRNEIAAAATAAAAAAAAAATNATTAKNIGSSAKRGFSLVEDKSKRDRRQKRFERELGYEVRASSRTSPPPSASANIDEPLVGKSTQLEKRYLRLTSAPDPEFVRPLPVLKKTLELLKSKWKIEQNYSYICDQFKSLRQDLTVQHIENEFTVSVYEIHARIALEKGDLGEYNQCQSRLKQLYALGIPGHQQEFLSYRILYLLHTQNRAELGHIMVKMTEPDLASDAIKHALKVSDAMSSRNYCQLFRLYRRSPNMGGYVMDSFVGRERLAALATMFRAYRPVVGVDFIVSQLAFQDREECEAFLNSYGVTPEDDKVDAKVAYVAIEVARQEAYKKVDIRGQI